MAGIYIHVPYCKTRCIYCDFYTQTDQLTQLDYVLALCKEIKLRKEYIQNEIVCTIYFGGGTPSLLTDRALDNIFTAIYDTFEVDGEAEITLEANPDDLSERYLKTLKFSPLNRLSLGIQSFDDEELKFLNRRHNSQNTLNAVSMAQNIGFENISIDLMYGLPNQTMEIWKSNLKTAISLNVQHISSYHLIYEEGTKLYNLFQKGKIEQVDEDLSLDMFSIMIDHLSDAGFEHYEISNFAKHELYSRHNTSYWQGEKYLGLGPSAHSYNGKDRASNINSISKYIDGIADSRPNMILEVLDDKSRYNDFILTGMRTKWGVDLIDLEKRFGTEQLNFCLKNVEKYILSADVVNKDNQLLITRKGIFISDGIMSDLMWI